MSTWMKRQNDTKETYRFCRKEKGTNQCQNQEVNHEKAPKRFMMSSIRHHNTQAKKWTTKVRRLSAKESRQMKSI